MLIRSGKVHLAPLIRNKNFQVVFYNKYNRAVFLTNVTAAISDIAIVKAEREVPQGIIYKKACIQEV